MKLVLADTKPFKEGISIVSDLVSEAKFKFNKNGFEIVSMDAANVAMVIFKMFSSCFTLYEVKDEEEVAINLNNLKQILRRIKGDDVLSLETTEDERLKIQMKSNTVRSFTLPTLEVDNKEQKVPDLNFPLSVDMDSSTLTDSIEDVSVVAESVTFLGEKNLLSVKAEGDLSKAFIEIKADDNTIINATKDDKFKAKYSLEYLKKMISGSKVSDRVSLKFNSDYPLRIEYKQVDKIMLAFILAPRVDND